MSVNDAPVFNEALAESIVSEDEWHYLDFVPFTFTSPSSLRYVDHLEAGEHIQRFARQLVFVYLALAFEYDGQIYIGDDPCLLEKHPELTANQNITMCGPATIERVITDVITTLCGDLTIIFKTYGVLVTISGGFQNAVFGTSPQFLNHLRLLARSQGLFLKHYVNGTRTLL